MKKEFVPYDKALKLKQLGFDEPCFGYWNKDPQLKNPTFNMVKPFEHEWCLPAPTFSQAFRWFREKYNLFGCIDLHPSNPIHWYIRIDDVIENDYIYHSEDEGLKFGTYEMGELACLDKLIEIVESKSE